MIRKLLDAIRRNLDELDTISDEEYTRIVLEADQITRRF